VDWDVFWSVLFVMFIVMPLLFIWGFAIVDLFTRPDLGGFGKLFWLLVILFLPLIGTIAYFLFRPTVVMGSSDVRLSGGSSYVEDRLTKLASLRDKGVISEDEFQEQRQRVLAMQM
jgi:hypothetical protein